MSCPHCKTRFDLINKGQFKKELFKLKEKNKPELDTRTTFSNQIKQAKKYKVTKGELNLINRRSNRSLSLDSA